MKKIYKLLAAAAIGIFNLQTNAQVSVYSFNQLSGTYNPIPVSGPSATAIAVGTQDDNSYANFPIGFNFLFNNTSFNAFGLNVNGWISLGTVLPGSSYNPISSGSANNVISAFGRDLQLGPYQGATVTSGSNVITLTNSFAANFFSVGDTISGTGIPLNATVTAVSAPNLTISAPATSAGTSIFAKGAISYQLSGTSPNQVLTIQWKNCGRWSATSTGLNDYMNFQIKLYETTNVIEVVYGMTGTTNANTATMEVGLRGNSNADFNNRSVLSGGSWAASTAGAVNSASGYFSSSTSPSTGQIYRWTPPSGCTGTPAANTSISNSSVVCTNGVVSLSLATSYTNTGYAYQWYSSTTGSSGPYTAISGGTTTVINATVTANTWYQAVVTCTNGMASTTATPVQVNVGGNACQCTAYCTSSATSVFDEEIFNVSVGTLNNSSTCGQTGGPGSVLNQYSNYTGILAAPNLVAGSTYSLSVTVGECNGSSFSAVAAVYMDFNQNGLFTDAGELVYTSPYGSIAVAGTTFTTNITIPAAATPGITRMRVVAVESSVVNPCGTFSWGETEDYCINIQAAAACSGAPGANTAVASASAVCPSGSVTINLATSYTVGGLTYQWSSATSSVGPYTAITGGTLNTLAVTNMTANTWFQAVITCTNGMASTTATPVQVVINNNPCQCASYCTSNATSTADEEIFNVKIGTLNNTSNCSQTGGPGSILNEYSNYTGILAAPSLTVGATYSLSLTAGECSGASWSAMIAAYIDYNQNGSFTDPGEAVYTSTYGAIAVAGTTFTSNITIPNNATPGITRMRVVLVESSVVNPCGGYTWGETEDYCVYIDPGAPCTVANGGFLSTSSFSACNNQSVALQSNSVSIGSGMSYQWMVSTTAGGPYTVVAGGSGSTTPSYTTLPLSATNVYYYVLQATCSNASLTGVSNEATVAVNPIPTASVSPVTPICAGQNIVLTSSTNIGTNFTWTGPNSFSSSVQNPTVSNAPAAAQGTYTLLVSANNCTSAPQTVFVTVNSTNLNVTTSPPVVCLGNSSTLTAVGNATTLTWSTGATTSVIVVSPTTNTVYSVVGTGNSNCTATVTTTVTVLNPTIAATGATVCVPGTTGTLTATAFGPVSWYATSTPTNALGTGNTFTSNAVTTTTYYAQAVSSSSNTLFTTLAAGNGFSGNMFDVVALNNIDVNGFDMHFSSTGTATVEVWYRPGSFVGFESSNAGWTMAYTTTATALGTGSLTPIPGSFTVSVPAGQTYGFYVTALSSGPQVNYTNGTALGNVYVQNSDAQIKEGKGGGYFSVVNSPRIFNGQMRYTKTGCTSPVVPVVFAVSSGINVTASAVSGTVCSGASTALNANGANTYTWSTGSTGNIIAVSPTVTTTYSVTGDNGAGCTGTGTVMVTVNPLPTVALVATQSVVCVNGPTVGLNGSPTGGAYTGSNVTTGVFTPGATAGTFMPAYSVSDPTTNCSNSASVTIVVSSCTGLDKMTESANGVQVYPNPNTGIFTIHVASPESYSVELSDLTGRMILNDKTNKQNIEVNISHLANGVYFVKVKGQDRVEVIKVIKE